MFEKRVEFDPAWDERTEGYGIGSMKVHFALIGPEGAVTFTARLGIYPPSVEGDLSIRDAYTLFRGGGDDISSHAYEPLEGSDNVECESCCYMPDGGPCYRKTSGIEAHKLFQQFVLQGDKVVWNELERWYDRDLKGSVVK